MKGLLNGFGGYSEEDFLVHLGVYLLQLRSRGRRPHSLIHVVIVYLGRIVVIHANLDLVIRRQFSALS